jgi:hypothetical protein
MNLCIQHPLEAKGKGIRRVGRIADKDAYTTDHAINIISQQHYFVACCLSSYVGNVFGLHSICVSFLSAHKLVIGEMCSLV